MTFQQLRYISEVARYGSINKAAKQLFVSQSSISFSIKELEAELSISIFQRSNRGITLTEQGRELLSYARPLLDQQERIKNIYCSTNKESCSRMSISTQRYPFTIDAFLSFLHEETSSYFEFHLKETEMYQVIDDVSNRISSIGVVFISNITERFIKKVLFSKNIEFHEIKRVHPHVYLRNCHPLAREKTLLPSSISPYIYVAFDQEHNASLEFAEEVSLMSFQKPARIIYVHDRATAINIIANTDSFTIGSGLLIEGLGDARIISLPLETSYDEMKLGWIKLKNKHLSPQESRFIDLLKESIQKAVEYRSIKNVFTDT